MVEEGEEEGFKGGLGYGGELGPDGGAVDKGELLQKGG